MSASEADLGSLLKVIRRRQASMSSSCKATWKMTSQLGLSMAQLQMLWWASGAASGHAPPLPTVFTWITLLIGSHGHTAEAAISLPGHVPLPRSPKFPLATVLPAWCSGPSPPQSRLHCTTQVHQVIYRPEGRLCLNLRGQGSHFCAGETGDNAQ